MSSSLNRETSSAPGGPGRLAPHRDAFLAELRSLGYAAKTVDDYRCAVDWFCARVHDRDPASVDVCVELAVTRQRERLIARFIGHLIDAGVAAAPRQTAPREPGPLDELSLAYGDWLRRQRGLAPKTVSIRQNVLRRFLTFRFGTQPGDLNAITRDDVAAFLDSPDPATGRTNRVYKAMCLRSMFGFLFATGSIRRDLRSCVPRVSGPRAGALARHLEPGEVRRLIDAVRGRAGTGRRDYAIVLLMARLGLRAQEVIAIRLEDIDWRAGEILVRGKGEQHECMPIPVDVGEAIAGYLQGARAGGARHLFVTAKAPYRPFGSSLVVRRILRQAFEKTELRPPRGEVRGHLLRHSLAVDMLDRGASLDDIGDVLRHRRRATTTIYARYDVEALRPLARPWPLQGGAR